MFYLSGFTNFNSHTAAREAFNKADGYAAMKLNKDGSAVVNYLVEEPIQHGQVEFNTVGYFLNVVRG